MLSRIHEYLDRSKRETWEYEAAATMLLELLLLTIAAIPVVTGPKSALAYALVAVLRLYETEIRREDASVASRHTESGGVSPLPPHKAARAAQRARALALVSWTWPALAALVQAADGGKVGLALVLSVVVTIARVFWGRVVMRKWRRSRLAWQNLRESKKADEEALLEMVSAAVDAVVGGNHQKAEHADRSIVCPMCNNGRVKESIAQRWERDASRAITLETLLDRERFYAKSLEQAIASRETKLAEVKTLGEAYERASAEDFEKHTAQTRINLAQAAFDLVKSVVSIEANPREWAKAEASR